MKRAALVALAGLAGLAILLVCGLIFGLRDARRAPASPFAQTPAPPARLRTAPPRLALPPSEPPAEPARPPRPSFSADSLLDKVGAGPIEKELLEISLAATDRAARATFARVEGGEISQEEALRQVDALASEQRSRDQTVLGAERALHFHALQVAAARDDPGE